MLGCSPSDLTGHDAVEELGPTSEATHVGTNWAPGGSPGIATIGGKHEWDTEWGEFEHVGVQISARVGTPWGEQPGTSEDGPVEETGHATKVGSVPILEDRSIAGHTHRSGGQAAGVVEQLPMTGPLGGPHKDGSMEHLPSSFPGLIGKNPPEHTEAEMSWGGFESAAVSAAARSNDGDKVQQASIVEAVDDLGMLSNLTVGQVRHDSNWPSQSAVVGHKVVHSDSDFVWEAHATAQQPPVLDPSAMSRASAGCHDSVSQPKQMQEAYKEIEDSRDSSSRGDLVKPGVTDGNTFCFVADTFDLKPGMMMTNESCSETTASGTHQQMGDAQRPMALDPCDTVGQCSTLRSPSPFFDKDNVGTMDTFTGVEAMISQRNNDVGVSPTYESGDNKNAATLFTPAWISGTRTAPMDTPSPATTCSPANDNWDAFQGTAYGLHGQEGKNGQQDLHSPVGVSPSIPVSTEVLLSGINGKQQPRGDGMECHGIDVPLTAPPHEVHHGHGARPGTQGWAFVSLDEWGSFQGEPALPFGTGTLSPAQAQAPEMSTAMRSPQVCLSPGIGAYPVFKETGENAVPGSKTGFNMPAVGNSQGSRDVPSCISHPIDYKGFSNVGQPPAVEDDGWGEFQSEPAADPFSCLNPIR